VPSSCNNRSQHKSDTYFKPGQSGNPHGRPKGSRHKLSESFIAAFYENFVAHGAEAIETMRLRNPEEYVRAAGAILPKQTEEIGNPFDGITSDELAALANLHTIRWLLSAIERAIASMRPKKQR
jgi:hypothetical protein